MPIHDFKQSFNAGELSPFMDARVAVEKYAAGCQVLENFIPHVHGPISKRAGTVFADGQITPAKVGRVIAWNFIDGEYSVMEFSDLSMRSWSDDSTVTGNIVTPYEATQLAAIKWAQVNTRIYLAHKDEPVNRITRSSAPSVSIAEVSWTYPALLDENVSATTLALSNAAVGAGRTLTASASYFTADNVGSYFEIAHARSSTFADLKMGDGAEFASVIMTITAAAADGDTFTIGTSPDDDRVYTLRTSGRDAVDEIDVGADADEQAANIVAAINTGGGGADPHAEVEAEDIGGLKAVAYFGNTAGTNLADNETITINGIVYKCQQSADPRNDPYEFLQGASLQVSLQNLMRAINRTPPADPEDPDEEFFYSTHATTGLTTDEHPDVEAVSVDAVSGGYRLKVQYRTQGPGGNSLTVSDTAANSAWYSDTALSSSTSTLAGGTRVIKIKARKAGADGNDIVSTETGSGLSFSGVTLSGGANETGTTSSTIVVFGAYEVRSSGTWDGTIELQKEATLGSGQWDTIRFWKSDDDYNINETGEVTTRTTMRLKFTGTGTDVDGVYPRAILTPTDPYVRGLVKVTGYTSGLQVTAEVLVAAQSTAATAIWSEGAWSPRRGYPKAVSFFQNRLWFANTDYEPSKLWGSAIGDYENFRVNSLDTGALVFQIAATENEEIQWLSVTHTLVIGTTMGIWVADATENQTGFTNTSPPTFRKKSAVGCADFQPVMMQDSLIYVVKHGRQLRRITYDENKVFTTTLLTVLADHVTGTGGVGNIAAQQGKDSILWAVNSDGELIGLTFDQEQNVFAWHRHPMSGSATVESVTVAAGPDGDEVWMTVSRNSTRNIEFLHVATHNGTIDLDTNAHLLCHVDSALYDSTAGTGVSSLTHLNGVGVIAWTRNGTAYLTQPAMSGTTQGTYTVSAGAITLASSATTAWVGQPIVSTVTTMRPEFPLRDGSSADRVMRPVQANIRVKDSSDGVLVFEGDTQSEARSVSVVSVSAGLYPVTKKRTAKLASRHREDGVVTVKHIGAGPFTLTGMVVQLDVGDSANNHPPGVTS
jgi:hypothetical protein